MEEKELRIEQNGDYKNINLKQRVEVDVNGKKVKTEEFVLNDGYVIVSKDFPEGKGFPSKFNPDKTNYTCKVTYKGENGVGFWLNEIEHTSYSNCGGEGDKVKITGEAREWKGKPVLNLSFEKVE